MIKIEECKNFEEAAKVDCDINCGIKLPHKLLEHDWCCQVCGGQHSERICPNSQPSDIPILNIYHTDKRLADLQIQNFFKSYL